MDDMFLTLHNNENLKVKMAKRASHKNVSCCLNVVEDFFMADKVG